MQTQQPKLPKKIKADKTCVASVCRDTVEQMPALDPRLDEENCFEENEHRVRYTKKFVLDDNYDFVPKKPLAKALGFAHRITAGVFLRMYLNLVHKVKIVGKQNAKGLTDTGVVVISNHIHPLDIQMVSVKLFGVRRVLFLTLQRNFQMSVRHLLRNSGGVPIPLDKEFKPKFFGQVNDFLKNRGVLHVCPEAALVDMCKHIRPFKKGAFRFCVSNNVPLLPVVINFDEQHGAFKKHPAFSIIVDKPVYPDPEKTEEENLAYLEEVAKKFMKEHCKQNYTLPTKTESKEKKKEQKSALKIYKAHERKEKKEKSFLLKRLYSDTTKI